MTTHRFLSSAFIAATLTILTACGGGGSTTTADTTAAGGGGSDPAGCTTLTYTANPAATGNPYVNGEKVCFLASITELKFKGKTLTSPTQNTAVTAPFSAYAFTDTPALIGYEAVFKTGVLMEINVVKPTIGYGQFK